MSWFMDAGKGDLRFGEVDDGIALVIFLFDGLLFEAQGTPAESPIFIVEEAVDGAAIDKTGVFLQQVPDLEEIRVEQDFDLSVGEEMLEEIGIAFFRDALPAIEKIIIVIICPEGEPVEDGRWELPGIHLPLFDGIILKKGLVELAAEQGDGLFFKVGGCPGHRSAQGDHELLHLVGFQVSVVELVYRRQVDREWVDPVLITTEYFVAISIESRKPADIVPDLFV